MIKKKSIDFIFMEECFQIIWATTTRNKFYFKQFVFKDSANTPIVIAKLHNDAGIYGLSEI